jgi:diazepam-binding inhibitor (GABA receptor modulating acyl-CoA-binding protein)
MNLSKRFERSSRRVWRLKEKPDDSTLLNLYALYKQATEGDAKSPRPIPDGMAGLAKWRAWRKLRGTSVEEAMERYCELVDSLMNRSGSSASPS